MNHYQELGVGGEASTEEIRQAYKTLGRLLHPDSQTDERVKAMAERQMRRLNGMVETLTEPVRRRRYDEELAGVRNAAEPGRLGRRRLLRGQRGRAALNPGLGTLRASGWVQTAVRYWFWVLVGAACAATAAAWWMMPRERPGSEMLPVRPAWLPVRVPVLEGAAARGGIRRGKRAAARGRTRQERYPPQAFIDPAARNQETDPPFADPVTLGPGKLVAEEEPIHAGQELPALEDAEADTQEGPGGWQSESGFAGNWRYTPQADEAIDPGAYPAVYIGLVVAEEHGELAGSFRGRYEVTDQAISAEVRLRMRARAPLGETARGEWRSGSGAKGMLEMTLQSPGVMSVVWWTTEWGSRRQLTSGSGVLVRQPGP